MVTFLTVVHITVCLFLILVVLLQAGKGGGMGIAFGGGGSQTVFGSSGAGNFLTRLTSVTAGVFLVTSLSLAHYSSRQDSKRLQELASERASHKKAEEDKAAKLKADLDKTRPATSTKDGGVSASPSESSGDPGAPATAPVAPALPGASLPGAPGATTVPIKMELSKPHLGSPATKPAIGQAKPSFEAPAQGSDLETTPPPVAPKRILRPKPAVLRKPAAEAPGAEPAPAEPTAPTAPPAPAE